MKNKNPKIVGKAASTDVGWPTVEQLEEALPDPETLADLAEHAPPKVSVERYWSTVEVLRAKNYSWREVSAWLGEQGVPIHYKRLERYAKALEDERTGEGEDAGED